MVGFSAERLSAFSQRNNAVEELAKRASRLYSTGTMNSVILVANTSPPSITTPMAGTAFRARNRVASTEDSHQTPLEDGGHPSTGRQTQHRTFQQGVGRSEEP